MSVTHSPEVGAGVTLHFEPVLDVVSRTVAGHRAFAQPARVSLRRAFGATILTADRTGMFSAAVIVAALAEQRDRPAGTFVSVPLGAALAVTRPVRAALESFPDLDGLVLDLGSFGGDAPRSDVERALREYRERGAVIAVAGVGSGRPELARLGRIGPGILRIGRDWVRGAGLSDAKRSALRTIGQLAENQGARVLAEGLTSADELRVLTDSRLPLAHGPAIAGMLAHENASRSRG